MDTYFQCFADFYFSRKKNNMKKYKKLQSVNKNFRI